MGVEFGLKIVAITCPNEQGPVLRDVAGLVRTVVEWSGPPTRIVRGQKIRRNILLFRLSLLEQRVI